MSKLSKSVFFIFVLIFISVFAKSVFAVGLIASPNRIIDFEPGIEKTFYFEVTSSRYDVNVSIYGYLSEYAAISKKLIKSKDTDRTFTVTVKLPEKEEGLKPGHHKIWVSAKEILGTAESGGNVGTSSNVIVYILVNILNENKYVEVELSAPNVNLNEPVDFAVNVKSFGKEDISKINAAIDVYSPDNEKIATVYTEEKPLKSNTEETLHAQLSTTGYPSGTYMAIAKLNYDGKTKQANNTFKIGELNIKIINYTKEFEKDKINKFDVEIESDWGNKIENVYGKIKINNKSIQTPNIDLGSWEKKTITAYWDTNNIEIGSYDAEMTVYYEDKTTVETGMVNVIEKKEAFVENPSVISLSTTTILILIIILLIIIDIVWIIKKGKSKEKQKTGKK
ncbi:hypothetical protein COY26_00920 [Candidatus Woesearchaeota archaeon CG_4_10_14_0_2_um_filter_33_10]|nr:MAG: hypothetical protein COV14_01755 [Candidatus Woesearchaeota archaeon CG10_big_fil_rev_8_21_14_0_10_33_12]PIU72061.1 MAG: hypothetical protein COS79_04665 [Candidatus Woesearchaeota archaeon CG06_land_8_20_14_3_00_33_13]PIZ53784.1 MAG: hypothetical protein COY26_00920 [Candidatus Woesearchaeota archaeon CG_4_10_14_0_2_um_filter_33_10]